MAILTLLLCSGYLISVYHAAAHISRGQGLQLSQVLGNAFTIPSLISLLLPYATTVDSFYYFHSDQSMINSYMGILVLLFAAWSIRIKKNNTYIAILILSILALLFSFGKIGGLRVLAFYYLPFMNLFRFPAVFRVFFILGILILSGYGMHAFLKQKNKKFLVFICLVLAAIILGVFFFVTFHYNVNVFQLIRERSAPTIFHRIVLQSFIQFLLLFSFLYFLSLLKTHTD